MFDVTAGRVVIDTLCSKIFIVFKGFLGSKLENGFKYFIKRTNAKEMSTIRLKIECSLMGFL